jgi:hypothetical protein
MLCIRLHLSFCPMMNGLLFGINLHVDGKPPFIGKSVGADDISYDVACMMSFPDLYLKHACMNGPCRPVNRGLIRTQHAKRCIGYVLEYWTCLRNTTMHGAGLYNPRYCTR